MAGRRGNTFVLAARSHPPRGREPRLQRLVQRHGKRVGAGALRRRRDARRVRRRAARAERRGASTRTRRSSARRYPTRRARRPSPASTSGSSTGSSPRSCGEHRAQAHAPRPRVRRGGRVRERRAARRPGRASSARSSASTWSSPTSSSATLRIYERLREAGHDSVGTVLQSYLYRTPDDLERLLPLAPNLRIVKGAYLEPAAIAYPEKRDVDRAYVEPRRARPARGRVHRGRDARRGDHRARAGVRRARGHRARPLRVPDALRRAAARSSARLAAEGYKVLVATPFGPDWYPYLMRRLAERPGEPRASSSRTSCGDERALPASRRGRRRRRRRHRHERRLPPRRGRRRRAAPRAGPSSPRGSTSRAAGGIRAQFSDPLNIAIGLRSIEAFDALRASALAPRSTSTRSATCSSSTARRTSPRSSRASRCRTSSASRAASSILDEVRELCPLAGLDGVARRDVLPARRAREPRGGRAGLRGRCARPRRHGPHRLRGDRHRGRDGGEIRGVADEPAATIETGTVVCAAGVWSPADRRARSGSSSRSSRTCARSDSPAPTPDLPDRDPAHDRLLDRLLLPPRGARAAVRDGRPRAARRLRRSRPIPHWLEKVMRGRGAAAARRCSTWASPAAGRATTR